MPIDFPEVSLMVRAHETELSIVQDVSQRKLLHKLTADQEKTLKAQGASDSLVQNLRSPNFVLPAADATAYETGRTQVLKSRDTNAGASMQSASNEPRGEHVRVFNVAFGHPLNLSQWFGSDYEIAVYSYRYAGEDYVEPVLIDNIRTFTDVVRNIPLVSEEEAFGHSWFPTNEVRNWRYGPYDSRGDLKDHRINFSNLEDNVVSGSSRSVARPLAVDWDNPVFIDGQPYTFYPIYGAGGASLYYIGKASDTSAKLAVVTHLR
ncbi:MAG: hypothetical protein QOI04_900 [Verrucomicrobiota bacterium]